MAHRMAGIEALNLFCDALGITDTDISRMVIEIDVNGIPKVYTTKVLKADAVLRVVEAIKGRRNGLAVEANPNAVEVVPLVLGGEG